MDPSVKTQLLLLVVILGVLILAFMLISNAMGNIYNVFSRLEEMIKKEGVLKNKKQAGNPDENKKNKTGSP